MARPSNNNDCNYAATPRFTSPQCLQPQSAETGDTRLMKLFYQTHSPYARKVLVMAHEANLADQLQVIHHETSPTQRNEDVFRVNPLGKVPVLVLADGSALFDSHVICEYLDGLHAGPRLIPAELSDRLPCLRLQALAQGICDAGIAVRHETVRRPEAYRYPAMRDGQLEKLAASYDFLEREWARRPALEPGVDIGQIAIATALSWIAFRGLPDFEQGRPRLSAWFRAFTQRPSMLATPLAGETVD
jgi:glutathione S-transferase